MTSKKVTAQLTQLPLSHNSVHPAQVKAHRKMIVSMPQALKVG